MRSKLIYLAGGITGLSDAEIHEWRDKIKDTLETVSGYKVVCCNPASHIPLVITPAVEREMFEWDLWKVKQSDIIICDFDHPNSIGTTWELAVARENGIPIIGLSLTDTPVHPWWSMSAIHISRSMDELYDYLCTNFLNDD